MRVQVKNFFLIVLVLAGIYCVGVAGPVVFASEGTQRVSRKGLPEEMVISADELHNEQLKGKKILLLDARSPISYKEAHVKGAILPLTEECYKQEKLFKKGVTRRASDEDAMLVDSMKKYPKTTPIVAYCSSGGCQASAVLVLRLKRMGFKDVKAMEDGVQTWEKKGYPVEKDHK